MIKKLFPLALVGIVLAGCTYQAQKGITPNNVQLENQTEESTNLPEASAQYTIKMANYTFSPASLMVKAGSVIAVINDDAVTHTLTSDSGEFEGGPVSSGKPGSFIAPTSPGRYPYHCSPHPNMKGFLIVK